ncbi:MAG: copper homeostasis protein CutC [Candidatus Cyclobacteriaceae bacterium M3_2C_046]
MKLEVCAYDLATALAAQSAGADRIELCAGPSEGGTTPSAGAIQLARKHLGIDLYIMIRPRGGDFIYSPLELMHMKHDVEVARHLGANGVVLGLLDQQGQIDQENTARMLEWAYPLNVTFHKAFDFTPDPTQALQELKSLGVKRILTSGGQNSTMADKDKLLGLIGQSEDKITIMAGGGITPENMLKVLPLIAMKEIHFSAHKKMESRLKGMGCNYEPDRDKIIRIRKIIDDWTHQSQKVK